PEEGALGQPELLADGPARCRAAPAQGRPLRGGGQRLRLLRHDQRRAALRRQEEHRRLEPRYRLRRAQPVSPPGLLPHGWRQGWLEQAAQGHQGRARRIPPGQAARDREPALRAWRQPQGGGEDRGRPRHRVSEGDGAAMNAERQQLDLFSDLSAFEGTDVEYKGAKGGLPGDLWRTYSAFANTEGGTIYLGITQRGDEIDVHGVE